MVRDHGPIISYCFPMSTTQDTVGTCRYCGGDRHIEASGDQFCSEECRWRDKGEKALRNIAHDHRFCSSCYKPLKIIFRPADSETPELRKKAVIIRESFVGFQNLTEHAQSGDYGVECECGNCDHYHAERTLRDGEPYEWYLKLCFTKFRREGQIDQRFDIQIFADTYWETDDFELAVGRALHA